MVDAAALPDLTIVANGGNGCAGPVAQAVAAGAKTLVIGVANRGGVISDNWIAVLRDALRDRGTVLIPAFSIGRTQALLYELEDILHRHRVAIRPRHQFRLPSISGRKPWVAPQVRISSTPAS